jgi:hypothetical protein
MNNNYINMRFISLIICLIIVGCTNSQELAHITVSSGDFDRIDCPVSFEFSGTELNLKPNEWQLVEIDGSRTNYKPLQADQTNQNRFWFILDGFTPKQTHRKFALLKKSNQENHSQIEIHKEKGALQFLSEKGPILNYQYEMTYPPQGVDEKFKKSGFLHPVWSPGGEVLTRIQPPDHYHHYGIWGPWTRTHIGERQVDFWNLGDLQGSVLFKSFLDETQGAVFSSFTAHQEHLDFGAPKTETVAINEALEVKVWNVKDANKTWLIDYTTNIKSPLKNGILFDAYRYGGGIGFRATEKWHKDNTSVLTSENKDRLTADGSSAKWAIIEGASNTQEGRSGILFMGFPENRQFPEPMRVWPVDGNGGRGDMFFEFCPIRHVEWKIESNTDYKLKYRMVIFDGEMTAKKAEIHWQGFANPPKVNTESRN